jgi:hypothetical protein
VGNNSSKGELIPHKTTTSSGVEVKGGLIDQSVWVPTSHKWLRSRCPNALSVKLSLEEGLAAHQLVGRVMAYQGYDG